MKKRFVVFSAFLSVLLLFSSLSVKANEIVFPAFPEPVEGVSSTHYLIIRDNETNNYFLFKPLESSGLKMTMATGEYRITAQSPAMIYTWNQGENNWNIYRQMNKYDSFTFSIYKYENGIVEFLYSSFDYCFYDTYSEGAVFFRKAPIKANFLEQMKMVQMGATLETLVLLVPLLLVLVTSFLAFRKALAWLLRVLRKS